MSNKKSDIENLNMDDLDVEELERRLELATGGGIDWGTYACDIDCPQLQKCTPLTVQ